MFKVIIYHVTFIYLRIYIYLYIIYIIIHSELTHYVWCIRIRCIIMCEGCFCIIVMMVLIGMLTSESFVKPHSLPDLGEQILKDVLLISLDLNLI